MPATLHINDADGEPIGSAVSRLRRLAHSGGSSFRSLPC